MTNSTHDLVGQHIRNFFRTHEVTEHQWVLGPVADELPELRVLCVAPGDRTGLWTYCSHGAHEIAHPNSGRLEFFLTSPTEDLRNVELVSLTAWYHKQHCLGVGHTLPIGEPWQRGSLCDSLLVSTPYPFGPELEVCNLPDGHVHILWLLPITSAEREFKTQHGLEALEQKFDDAELKFWDATRASVVVEVLGRHASFGRLAAFPTSCSRKPKRLGSDSQAL